MIGATPQAVQQRSDAGLLHQGVGHPLEHLGVERVTQRLRLGHGRAHGLRALLELDADPFAVHRAFVAVPGKTFDPHLSDVAARSSRCGRSAPCGRRPWPPRAPAASPPGPLPTTRTSVSRITSTERAGSSIFFIRTGPSD